MKEAYQQAVMQSESSVNIHKAEEKIESCDTKSLKERFEKGHLMQEKIQKDEDEETEVYQSGKFIYVYNYVCVYFYIKNLSL